jgi:3-oxoacyl-[acyl-carrier-protein] synthase II
VPKRRVVVTGMSAITPIGTGLDEFWNSLKNGITGIRRITRFDAHDYPCQLAAEVDFDVSLQIEKREARKMDRFCQLAVVASRMAITDAGGVDKFDPISTGVLIGTGIGGMGVLTRELNILNEKGPSRVSPFLVPMMIANMASGQVSIDLGLKGPIDSVVTACATGTNAIGDAFEIIRRGDADAMVCGGTEAPIVPLALAGFCSLKALSTQNELLGRACRPFDKRRDGFIMGEGAAVLILESLDHARQRDARIYAEVVGYGMSSDAYHITAPSPGGEGAVRAMRMAIRDASVSESEIDYINAHGTSTPANDSTETAAIRTLLGDHANKVMVSSVKSMIGHLLGAAGAVETVATVLSIANQMATPTINYEEFDEACDLDYVPNVARKAPINVALKNSFGFGGQNACLVLKAFKE